MRSTFRKVVLVAAATALLSAQAAYAAPVNRAPALDPLVSLSALGTPQSRTAVCGAGEQCALPSSTMVASAAPAAAAQPYDEPARRGPGIWPLLLGIGVVLILMAVILSDGGDASGELTPVSP